MLQKSFDKYFSFQVFNFIGKKVLDLKTVTPKMNIPLTDFYRGVYIYQLRDRSGKIIINPQFDGSGKFSDGLAWVSVGGKIGFVDKSLN